MPSILIEPRTGGGPIVTVTPCEGTTIVMTMPEGVYVFDDDGRRGLEGFGHSLSIHRDDGTLEYDSQTAEYSLHLPDALAADLYAAFEGQTGRPLEGAIELGEDAEEDPQQVAGRKRHSRIKKQTRRTQRKRRNTVRK